ncbi:MAG TPA: Gfo/Idh/MocA family oxidoreductase [Gammaproteobacteria bacterium]|jgi:predicted dehydrogenase|nr:Gfo/Idh/MocA family oxidoreductase [Gammaproteobacteria bacterium]
MSKRKTLTRRGFLKGAAAAGATSVFGAGSARSRIVHAAALGADGNVAPSNRIALAAIGIGIQGTVNMAQFLKKKDVQLVAVCDVDEGHRDEAKSMVDQVYGNEDCKAYSDFRELIGRDDLDAVALAIPDHWHALLATEVAKAGLDIYGEKPLARSVREGRAICDAVSRYNRVWQTGSWQRSRAQFHRACELVRNGRIGKVHKVEVGLPDGGCLATQPVEAVPEGLDWNMWLGPAPYVPYRPFGDPSGSYKRCHFNWRWIMDYSGGQLTDWAGHHIDIAHWGLGLEHTGPVEVEGKGDYPDDGIYNTPAEYTVHCTYADGLRMTVSNARRIPMGTKWHGEDGWIHVSRDGIVTEPIKILSEVIGPEEIRLYKSTDHFQDFLDCVKSRQSTITPPEDAQRSISVALLGEIAMLLGRRIRWDPENEAVVDDPSASALLGRSYREPWCL